MRCCIYKAFKANKAMKPSKLLWHMQTNNPGRKDKFLGFVKRRKHEHEREKQLLRAATSTNVNVLKASYLVAHRFAKANKGFTTEKEVILPASMDICRKVLREAEPKETHLIVQVSLLACTVSRRIKNITEDNEVVRADCTVTMVCNST